MSNKTARHAFLLGCERSGSTWLANILNAHPGVELFMEPFAPYAGLFPDIPGRFQSPTSNTSSHFPVDFGTTLRKAKYPLLYRPGRPMWLHAVDRMAAVAVSKVQSRIGTLRQWHSRYTLLNLHSSEFSCSELPKKFAYPQICITKELRLNFQIAWLNETFPDAPVVVTIRHPGSQLTSIKSLFVRGNLGELKRDLSTFFTSVKKSERFRKFHDMVKNSAIADNADPLDYQLCLWWLINYDLLFHDLAARSTAWRIVSHEELCGEPQKTVSDIFQMLDLPFSEPVRSYISKSTTTSPQSRRPLDTNRVSKAYTQQTIKNCDQNTLRCLQSVLQHPSIRGLLDPLLSDYILGTGIVPYHSGRLG